MKDLFRGELVRLTSEEPQSRAKQQARWQMDSEYQRLMSGNAVELYSAKKFKTWIEQSAENDFKPDSYYFSIRSLADDQLIGFLGMWFELIHREIWLGVGIGDRANWGKGYGSDALKLCLQYSFMELSAQRITLMVYEYNARALKSYEKAGFRLEGRTRQDVFREGKRYDSIWMGILRAEWLALQKG